jgi:hypothetical protein
MRTHICTRCRCHFETLDKGKRKCDDCENAVLDIAQINGVDYHTNTTLGKAIVELQKENEELKGNTEKTKVEEIEEKGYQLLEALKHTSYRAEERYGQFELEILKLIEQAKTNELLERLVEQGEAK